MLVISDASPILNLVTVGHLDILERLYSRVLVPRAVVAELTRHGIVLLPSWIEVRTARDQRDVAGLLIDLDPGEAEAIALATELGAQLILIDEKAGRRIVVPHTFTMSNR